MAINESPVIIEIKDEDTVAPTEHPYQIKCPIGFNWVIDKDIALNKNKNEWIYSKAYSISGFPKIKYRLALHFGDEDDDEENRVVTPFFYFHLDDWNDITCKFYMNAKLKFSNETIYNISKWMGNCLGDEENLVADDIELFEYPYNEWIEPENPYIVDDKMTIIIEGHIIIEKAFYSKLYYGYPHKLLSEINALKKDIAGRDFAIAAEGQELKVHKGILQRNSTVFARMDELNWKETVENRIEIPDISFKLLQIAIDLLYNNSYSDFLEKDEYIELYFFADKYDFEKIRKAVKRCMLLTPFNVVEYANLAVKYSFDLLKAECQEYLVECSKCWYPIENIKMLNDEIKNIVFYEIFTSSKIALSLQCANVCYNNEGGEDEIDMEM